MAECIGWAATAIFTLSYFSRRPNTLRRIQAAAAGLWIVYGLSIKALPVVIANVTVAGAAIYSLRRRQRTPDITANTDR